MFKFVSICFLLLVHFASAGKNTEHFTGYLLVQKKRIHFELDYTVQSNNLIVGTSMTARGTSDETKCRIKGKYNRKNHSIYFYETVVLNSKAKYENLNFCLLTAKMKRTLTKSGATYNGSITGYVRGSKKKCASGTIYLKQKKESTPLKPTVKKIAPVLAIDTLFSDLKHKKQTAYHIKSSKLRLAIWDDANEDGDRISIFLNGKEILGNYKLKRTKKEIAITLPNTQKIHYLKIKALNEGLATPNTSRIQIKCLDQMENIRAHIKTNEAVYIALET